MDLVESLFDLFLVSLKDIGLPSMVDEIQQLPDDKNRKEREWFSTFAYELFSDVALCAHIHQLLATFPPWLSRFRSVSINAAALKEDLVDDT